MHEWRDRTDDGRVRLVRATHHAGRWRIESRVKGEPAWTTHEPPLLDDLHTLSEIVEAKYRRNRVSHELLEQLRRLIAAREAPPE